MVSVLKPLLEGGNKREGDRARVNFFSDSVFHDEAPLLAGELLNEVKLRGEQSVSFA